jgi:hypothetical protein
MRSASVQLFQQPKKLGAAATQAVWSDRHFDVSRRDILFAETV